MAFPIPGCQAQVLAVSSDRVSVPVLELIEQCQIAILLGIIRVGCGCLLVGSLCFFRSVEVEEGISEVVEDDRAVWSK